MPKPTTHSCLNCAYATWEMTAHTPPRINPHSNGRCRYKAPIPALPAAMAARDKQTVTLILQPVGRGFALNPRTPFTDCPCWLAQDAAPAGEEAQA